MSVEEDREDRSALTSARILGGSLVASGVLFFWGAHYFHTEADNTRAVGELHATMADVGAVMSTSLRIEAAEDPARAPALLEGADTLAAMSQFRDGRADMAELTADFADSTADLSAQMGGGLAAAGFVTLSLCELAGKPPSGGTGRRVFDEDMQFLTVKV